MNVHQTYPQHSRHQQPPPAYTTYDNLVEHSNIPLHNDTTISRDSIVMV
jgi:hypothetical protein